MEVKMVRGKIWGLAACYLPAFHWPCARYSCVTAPAEQWGINLVSPYGDERTTRQYFSSLFERFWRWYWPSDEKWKRINSSLFAVYAALIIPVYLLGASNSTAKEIVSYFWSSSIFVLFSRDLPYSCDRIECEYSGRVVFLFIGGAITVRIVMLCFELLEKGLGIDVLSRLIDKYLPGKKQDSEKH